MEDPAASRRESSAVRNTVFLGIRPLTPQPPAGNVLAVAVQRSKRSAPLQKGPPFCASHTRDKELPEKMRIGLLILAILLCLCGLPQAQTRPDEANTLYQRHQSCIYQIRVIETISGKKASIGSGFRVSASGHIATNYHVVAQVIDDPDLYRLEYVDSSGRSGGLDIIDIDVVHDLAVVRKTAPEPVFLDLRSGSLAKGTRIYALGNPYDLGMTIVEGTYNGLLEKSLYEKILFSGSLNPGMSGGPVLGREGKVVGVSVSTAGNQVSFLVPVAYLQALLNRIREAGQEDKIDFHDRIEEQLYANQNQYMSRLLSAKWQIDSLGDALVPRPASGIFKCWGNTDKDDDALYGHTHSGCASSDNIYLTAGFNTGRIRYRYDWYVAKGLNRHRLYSLLESRFEDTRYPNAADKEDVTNYTCNTDFVRLGARDWKVAVCSRNYKRYPRLNDMILKMASVSEPDRALLVDIAISGVSEKMALAFVRKIMEELDWRD
jgi:S1-C subfamily serine protease